MAIAKKNISKERYDDALDRLRELRSKLANGELVIVGDVER